MEGMARFAVEENSVEIFLLIPFRRVVRVVSEDYVAKKRIYVG
jgi:hypothetical protein